MDMSEAENSLLYPVSWMSIDSSVVGAERVEAVRINISGAATDMSEAENSLL